MRQSMLTTIAIAGALVLGLGLSPVAAQTATNQPEAAPATTENTETLASATQTTTTNATAMTTHAGAAARQQRASQTTNAAFRSAAGDGVTEEDLSFAQQQQQEARLIRDQDEVLHAYIRAWRRTQAEPRIQDSLGDQPPPYAPVIPPSAAPLDAEGIQEAPGPAQTTPKLAIPPTAASQQSQPSTPPQ
jgi:hypothetical protein